MANEYLNMTELIKDYYDKPVGEYLNRTVTINNVELACDIYRVAPETVLTPTVFTGCTAVDSNTQIVIGRDMSVASGTTLIPPYRCKGIIIGDVGTFTNEGTISMTARGASGAGKNIQLTADYMISAVGGAGGVGANNYSSGTNFSNGKNGDSPTASVLSCGGGGSGGAGHNSAAAGHSGVGGTGTSFSGGAGSGGAIGTTSSAGSSSGGAGSNGLGGGSNGYNATGGAGNPSGTSTGSSVGTGGNGTGGLIIILANNLVQSGSLIANGIQAAGMATTTGYITDVTGGSSGGGCIVLISKTRTITGTNSVTGGIAPTGGDGNGGAGGVGVYASYIVDDLVLQNLPVEFAITDKAHLDNIEPSEAVRFLVLTDDDELQYDIMGKRHRAMNTEAEIDFSRLPSRGQRTPDAFEVDINNPQDGQGIVYNSAQQKWVNGAGGTPVGTIIQFFGYTAPNGYLACDGTEYLKADYPALATLLADLDTHYSSAQYVGSDNDHFKVPDLRGEFLRGTGTNGHTNQGNGANVGVHQDATQIPYFGYFSSGSTPMRGEETIPHNEDYVSPWETTSAGRRIFSSSISTNTDSKNNYTPRPTNTSVLMCIKAI